MPHKNLINRIRIAAFILTPIFIVLSQQACSQVKFSGLGNILTGAEQSSSPGTQPVDSSASSNGGTYGGRLRILHHYVDNFSCEGRPQPESILIQTNTNWVIIQNTVSHCGEVNQAPVANVVYDDVAKVAVYNNTKYIPPHPYVVDPTEDPNLPDIQPIDGVCEDKNFKCSLAAALTSAGYASWTADSAVTIPSSIYLINTVLSLNGGPYSHNILIKGQGSASTILDGQNATSILDVVGNLSSGVQLDGIDFRHGFSNDYNAGSALTNDSKGGSVMITNSRFENNVGASAVTDNFSAFNISNSQFINNSSSYAAILLNGGAGTTLDQVVVTGDTGTGFEVAGGVGITIQRSYFAKNAGNGIYFLGCKSCLVENTTITGNGRDGFYFFQNDNPADIFRMNNVTIVDNSTLTTDANFEYEHMSGQGMLITNSIIASRGSLVPACRFGNLVGNSTINANNNIFSDSSCVSSGINTIADPLIEPNATPNGGMSPTFLPLMGSPAIDAGDNSTCATTDQRGYPRPIDKLGGGAICDIGAVELE